MWEVDGEILSHAPSLDVSLLFSHYPRYSTPKLDTLLLKLRPLINKLSDRVKQACHHTNQWLLLRNMLETRLCSPLLLPESPSEAWVEEVVHKRVGVI